MAALMTAVRCMPVANPCRASQKNTCLAGDAGAGEVVSRSEKASPAAKRIGTGDISMSVRCC